VRRPAINNSVGSEIGGDIKYAVTPNLTADLTVNTDFAQVEADEQQVNLTRFSLFFPEKREFFLEGRGIFDFARGGNGAFGGSGGADTPQLFYTRRIGLDNGGVVPINVGGRLTGKLGKYAVGLMNIGTSGDAAFKAEPTNFTVVRVKRDGVEVEARGARQHAGDQDRLVPTLQQFDEVRHRLRVLPRREHQHDLGAHFLVLGLQLLAQRRHRKRLPHLGQIDARKLSARLPDARREDRRELVRCAFVAQLAESAQRRVAIREHRRGQRQPRLVPARQNRPQAAACT
jgi:hypothetical protein